MTTTMVRCRGGPCDGLRVSETLGPRWVAAAHLDPTTRQRVLGHYVLWRDHYHWVLHAPGGGSDMEYREVMGLVEIVAKPDPQATTEADWDTDIGDRLTVGALTGLRYGGTICDAPIRVFGQHHDAAPEH